MAHKSLYLGCEREDIPVEEIVKRLDPQPITSAEERSPPSIPDGEGEHSPKTFYAGFAPILPCVKDRLGVAMRSVMVSRFLEIRTQVAVIIDLSVVDDREIAIFIEHRLAAASEI